MQFFCRRVGIPQNVTPRRSQGAPHLGILGPIIHRTHGGPGVVFFKFQLVILFLVKNRFEWFD